VRQKKSAVVPLLHPAPPHLFFPSFSFLNLFNFNVLYVLKLIFNLFKLFLFTFHSVFMNIVFKLFKMSENGNAW